MAPFLGNNGQLSRDERVQLYGIDCEDQITWTDWEAGTEMVNELVLRNVALVTQKVRFNLPPTKEFDMPYPEPFKLAPGMKKSIPISFRPSRYTPHVDKVEIVTQGGSFFVTVKAVVKDIAISLPQFIDFGLCPAFEKSEYFIDVHNTGTLKAALKWHAKPPFSARNSRLDQSSHPSAQRCPAMVRRRDLESGMAFEGDSPQVHLAVESARRDFIRKVYGIVCTQLCATALIAAPIATANDMWLEEHAGLMVFSLVGFVAMGVCMFCCPQLLRQYPTNFVVLAGFTVLEAITVGFICARYEIQSVVWCLGATAAIAAGLTIFAMNTKADVTQFGGYLAAISFGLFIFGLIGLFAGVPLLRFLYSIGGALLASGYIVYDTQLILGGKHQQKRFTIDDYVLAAMCIYMDLVRLFLHLLRLFGEQRRSSR